MGIVFQRNSKLCGDPLLGFVDSKYAANVDNKISQSIFVFTLYRSVIS